MPEMQPPAMRCAVGPKRSDSVPPTGSAGYVASMPTQLSAKPFDVSYAREMLFVPPCGFGMPQLRLK